MNQTIGYPLNIACLPVGRLRRMEHPDFFGTLVLQQMPQHSKFKIR
jgi:hypothetical protein